jgi:hypothetical protein
MSCTGILVTWISEKHHKIEHVVHTMRVCNEGQRIVPIPAMMQRDEDTTDDSRIPDSQGGAPESR